MQVAIRTDASWTIGGGHLHRCLSLAHYLREFGFEVSFFTKKMPEPFENLVRQRGFRLFSLDNSLKEGSS